MAAKRRDNKGRVLKEGEFQRADGRYEYRYLDAHSNRKSVYSWRLSESDNVPAGKRACVSLRELEQSIAKDLADGVATDKRLVLDTVVARYLENKCWLKPTTLRNYREMYRVHVQPRIGKMRIADIKHSAIKTLYSELLNQDKLSIGSVNIIHSLLHPVFESCVYDEVIRSNPTNGVLNEVRPQNAVEPKRRFALTPEQQKAFLSCVEWYDAHLHALFVCLFGTGCRIGEMLGLRWTDVDWEHNTISINHTLVYCNDGAGTKCRFRITSPKTQAGVRVIPMFQSVRNALLRELEWQRGHGFCQIVVDGYSGFIWQNSAGHLLEKAGINKRIGRIVQNYNRHESCHAKKNGRDPVLLPKFTAHYFRHTFCTRLCENESDYKIIQEIMGHSSIVVTMDVYNKVTAKRKQDCFSNLEASIGSAL